MGIILLILIVVNWLIYHHIFRVYYLGSVGQSIIKEIFGCSLVAVIELAIIMTVGGWILGAVLIIGAILLIVYVAYRIYKFVKNGNSKTSEKEQGKNEMNSNGESVGNNESNGKKDS